MPQTMIRTSRWLGVILGLSSVSDVINRCDAAVIHPERESHLRLYSVPGDHRELGVVVSAIGFKE